MLTQGPFGGAVVDPSKESRQFKPIPPNITLYGVITDASLREYTKSDKSKDPGRQAQIWNLTFKVLGGEYAGQQIWADIFMDIEWREEMGQWLNSAYGSIGKGVELMEALGYPSNTILEGTHAGKKQNLWLPPNEKFFTELTMGSGAYAGGKPMINTIIGIKTGTDKKPEAEKNEFGKWVKKTDADGKQLYKTVTGIASFFEAPEAVKDALAEELAALVAPKASPAAVPVAADDDIPF